MIVRFGAQTNKRIAESLSVNESTFICHDNDNWRTQSKTAPADTETPENRCTNSDTTTTRERERKRADRQMGVEGGARKGTYTRGPQTRWAAVSGISKQRLRNSCHFILHSRERLLCCAREHTVQNGRNCANAGHRKRTEMNSSQGINWRTETEAVCVRLSHHLLWFLLFIVSVIFHHTWIMPPKKTTQPDTHDLRTK